MFRAPSRQDGGVKGTRPFPVCSSYKKITPGHVDEGVARYNIIMSKPERDISRNLSHIVGEAGVSPVASLLDDLAARLRLPRPPEPEEHLVRVGLDSAAIVAIANVQGTIRYVSGKFCEISGYEREELIGSNHRMLRSGLHETPFYRLMYREIAGGRIWRGEICSRRKDGSLYWVESTIVPHVASDGQTDSYISIHVDITSRKRLEEELRASTRHLKRIAHLDPLTGLPNWRRFQQYAGELAAEHAATGRPFHLALLDVDRFRQINDAFGHLAGDALLQAIATRLRAIGHEQLFIARLGGDEFGLILRGASNAQADLLFETVLESIRRPIRIGGVSRRCSASLGLALFPRHGRDVDALFKAAHLALYHAKSLGRDRFEPFVPKLREIAECKSELLREIEQGLQCGAFGLHYQPIVPVAADRAVSLEALMRWQHPQRGLLIPGAFQDGFLDPAMRAALGMFMLERVFRDMVEFREKNIPLHRVAINLTNSDFRSDAFLNRFFELFDETGIGPERFSVEVTEGMFLDRDQKRVGFGLRRLHRAGVEVALDDFGTGYGSLIHLRRLPIDRLKIDHNFVANIVRSREDQSIVRGIIQIAHSLGKAVTAEGVETAEQAALLRRMNCDQLQGWYFGRASEPGALPAVLGALPRVAPACPSPLASRRATISRIG